jgi:hypothetical protein
MKLLGYVLERGRSCKKQDLTPGVALLLCGVMTVGCATSGARGVTVAPTAERQTAARDVLTEYVRTLAPGSRVRVGRASGSTISGTLMKTTDRSLVIQPRTRVPEPPLEIALAEVVSVTPESTGGTNVGKIIGIAAAAGAGAAVGLLMILAAIYAD